jgi:DNA-binding response OmpR family regulator
MPDERRRQPADRRRPALVVSANPDTVDLYVMSLRNERSAVLGAATVSEAMHLIRDHAISAVVLDIAHPVTDWDACRAVIEHAERTVPVVILTGWLDEDARRRALELGCAAFVAKPASPQRVSDILQRTRAGERGIVAVE